MKSLRPLGSALGGGHGMSLTRRLASRAHSPVSWLALHIGRNRTLSNQVRWHSTRQQARPLRSSIPLRSFIAAAALAGAVFYFSTSGGSHDATLNDTSFTPYTITAREAISPTSFVITVSPNTPQPSLPYLLLGSSSWKHPLWSVEFKQPEVQIARHYTPLPPRPGDDPRDGTLRFYVRAIGDGEMSNYLSRLRQGHAVWLRGPHRGFDVLGRLGSRRQLVVLAGGTGVVPGMQAAEAVLGSRGDTAVKIMWAVRKREELQQKTGPPPRSSSWWHGPKPTEMRVGLDAPSPVGRQLEAMKAKYGDRIQIHVAVDEEKSAFSQKFISAAVKTVGVGRSTQHLREQDCRLHSQALHQTSSEFEMETPDCACAGEGKNLLLVSGPDGFITHYTGPKIWLGGSHTQGPVGGVARQVQERDPCFKDEWLVLKL